MALPFVGVCACVRACVQACVLACVCARVFVFAPMEAHAHLYGMLLYLGLVCNTLNSLSRKHLYTHMRTKIIENTNTLAHLSYNDTHFYNIHICSKGFGGGAAPAPKTKVLCDLLLQAHAEQAVISKWLSCN
jgi:hypothetical protein